MRARDIMTREVVTVAPNTPVEKVAQILLARHISAVPVIDADRHVVGIVSEGDLIQRAEIHTAPRRSWAADLVRSHADAAKEYLKVHGRRAADVMTAAVVVVYEDTPLVEITALFEKRRIKRVPVVRDGRLVGIVSRADILQAFAGALHAFARPGASGPATTDDETLREQLVKHLRDEGLPGPPLVNIVVKNGVVHLQGVVESDVEREALRVAAEVMPGVHAVENHLNRHSAAGAQTSGVQ